MLFTASLNSFRMKVKYIWERWREMHWGRERDNGGHFFGLQVMEYHQECEQLQTQAPHLIPEWNKNNVNVSFRGRSYNFFHSGGRLFSTAGKTTDQQCSLTACYHGEDTQSWDLSTEAKPNSTRTHSLTPRVLTHVHRYASCVHRHTQRRSSKQGLPLALVTDLELPHLERQCVTFEVFFSHTCMHARTGWQTQLSFWWGRDELYSLDMLL